MAVIANRTSLLINLCPQTAGVTGLYTAVLRLIAQTCGSFAITAMCVVLLGIEQAARTTGRRIFFGILSRACLCTCICAGACTWLFGGTCIRPDGMIHRDFLRCQLLLRRVAQIDLQPLAQDASRSLRHINKLNAGAAVPVLPHHLAGES